MTLKLLKQYRAILREIPDLRERIRVKRREVDGHYIVMASLDEPPYTQGHYHIDDPGALDDMRATLAIMQRRLRRITRQRKQIETYIDSIEDSQLRQEFQYYFIDGLTWQSITIKNGEEGDGSAVAKRVYKHIKFSKNSGKGRGIIKV